MRKRILSVFVAAMLVSQTAFSAVLGSETVGSKSYEISDGTMLYENKFMSDQEGVGLQSEYYAEYTPNSDTVPVVVTGESIFGKKTAAQAAAYMRENGMRPMIGINAAFFSLQNGVTMGHIISEGRVFSKDSTTLQGIGFNSDGAAFIAPLAINVSLSTEEGDVGIANVNKFNGATLPYITLFTPDFSDNTENEAEVVSVVVETDESLRVGGEFEAVVKSKSQHTGGVALNEGEMVITVNVDGSYDYHRNLINSLNEGDTVKISCSADGDERWADVSEALASVGETLISDGNVSSNLPKGAAPRTAVGITDEGKVVFYVIDGRQKGISYGVQLKTLAARMAELGCVEAINLDGGGSTSISGVYPGADEIAVINSPSDGSLRPVANFIFLKNNKPRTDILASIYTTPHQNKYLSGTKVELSSIGIDTAYYKTELQSVEYFIDGESYLEENTATLIGNGTVRITAKSGAVQSVSENYVYDTPDTIKLYSGKKEIQSLTVPDGEKIELSAKAFVGSAELIADDSLFAFDAEGEIGTVENGVFSAKADVTTKGNIIITAGNTITRIPVTVTRDNIFKDASTHWAKDMINELADMDVISGYETDDGLYFKPDNSISRAEFAVMLARYMKLDTKEHEIKEDYFTDVLPNWAKGSINALSSLGFISGKQTDDGVVFAANDEITRAEAAAIIGRTMPELDIDEEIGFADSEQIPHWASSYVAKLYSTGVVSGGDGNNYMPNRNVTRAESATMLYKLSKIQYN
ncbi:MAG: S-layer homology domain-containing protein [Eubacteriales bacterium]|nr:S-layer homology domain-containing protein [Eubacteriales bacterium]